MSSPISPTWRFYAVGVALVAGSFGSFACGGDDASDPATTPPPATTATTTTPAPTTTVAATTTRPTSTTAPIARDAKLAALRCVEESEDLATTLLFLQDVADANAVQDLCEDAITQLQLEDARNAIEARSVIASWNVDVSYSGLTLAMAALGGPAFTSAEADTLRASAAEMARKVRDLLDL